jgi:acyl-CoA dehydrogenase
MRHTLRALAPEHPAALLARDASLDSVGRLSTAAESLLASLATAPDRAMAVSVPFLKLCGITIGGWLMARAADIAARRLAHGDSDREFLEAKIASAHFYATQVLAQTLALEHTVLRGSDAVVSTDAALI